MRSLTPLAPFLAIPATPPKYKRFTIPRDEKRDDNTAAAASGGSGAADERPVSLQVRELRETNARLMLQLRKAQEECRRLSAAASAASGSKWARPRPASASESASAAAAGPMASDELPTRDGDADPLPSAAAAAASSAPPEGAAAERGGAALTSEPAAAASASLLGASSPELARWEESKRLQQRVQALKSKLVAKTKEAQEAHRELDKLRADLEAAARDRQTLSAKLRAATDPAGPRSATGRRAADVARLRDLSQALAEAEDAAAALRRQAEGDKRAAERLQLELARAREDARGGPPRPPRPSAEEQLVAARREAQELAVERDAARLELRLEREQNETHVKRVSGGSERFWQEGRLLELAVECL